MAFVNKKTNITASYLNLSNRGSRRSRLLGPPASRVLVPATGASSSPTPPHCLPLPPSISTPPPHSPPSPAPTLTPPFITPPPLFRTRPPPFPSAKSHPPPSFAPPDLGPPASPRPLRPLPHSPSAPHRRRASAMCRRAARSHAHTCRPSQSGGDIICLGYDVTNLRRTAQQNICVVSDRSTYR